MHCIVVVVGSPPPPPHGFTYSTCSLGWVVDWVKGIEFGRIGRGGRGWAARK
jgi:hypothetical protein